MKQNHKYLKPPLSKKNKSAKDIAYDNEFDLTGNSNEIILPSVQRNIALRNNPIISPKYGRKSTISISPRNNPQVNDLYSKIQGFDSPKPAFKFHKYSNSSGLANDFLLRGPFKTPSPRSSRNEECLSSWEIQQALLPPKSRNISGKRRLILNELKSL